VTCRPEVGHGHVERLFLASCRHCRVPITVLARVGHDEPDAQSRLGKKGSQDPYSPRSRVRTFWRRWRTSSQFATFQKAFTQSPFTFSYCR
jgi:hypothetical protein